MSRELSMKLPLQYFAEDGEAEEATTTTEETPETVDVQKEAEKIANAIVARKLKDMPSKDEVKAFKTWKESQKTEQQKIDEEIQALREQSDSYKSELTAYKHEKATLKAGVSAEFAEFVAHQAGKKADENTDFDTALTEYLTANPQYKTTAKRAIGPTPGAIDTKDTKAKANQALRDMIKGE